jgi:hypothetical protein
MQNINAKRLAGNVAELIDAEPGHEYIINVELTAATGASAVNDPITLVGSLPFAWEELGAHFNETNGDWDIKITDNSASVSFSPDKIPLIALVGDDKQPYILKNPWIFQGGSSIYVEGTNNGSGTDTLKLTFIGKRLTAPQT